MEKNTTSINFKKEVQKAEKRIRPYIRESPVEYSFYLSQLGSFQVYFKLENMQVTGSFKIRGVLNFLLSLTDRERERGIVTASSGNHGVAFAYALKKFGWKGTIFLPENASKAKIRALQSYNVDMRFYGTDCVETEEFARDQARNSNLVYVSPYNDLKIIGGQGTIGIELMRQIKKIDAVFVPVGGGGLISGIAGYLKSIDRTIEIVGCQPVNSPVMYESVKAGKIIEMESLPTISDGSAGGIEQGAVTFEICRDYVDDFVLVSEDEIKEAIKLFLEKNYMLIEGAAALSLASYTKIREKFEGKNVVLIVSGSKISLDQLKEILCEDEDK